MGDTGGARRNFINFCTTLNNKVSNTRIIYKEIIGQKWHEKVATKFGIQDGKKHYYAALVGSR